MMQKYMEDDISLFIKDAMALYNKGHYTTSLTLTCCAIDACAKIKYFEKSNGARIRQWINDHIRTISEKGLSVTFGRGCKFNFGNIPYLRKDKDNFSGIEDVIYSLIRCTLIHECRLSNSVILGNKNVFSYNNEIITFPHMIVVGLIKAVGECLSM